MNDPRHDPTEAELLQTLLASRDIACPVCGYNLRTISSSHCPECGAQLDLRVGSTDLKLGPWLTSIISTTLALGFVGIYTVTAIPVYWIGLFGRYWMLFVTAVALCLGYTVLLWRLIRRRKKYWTRPRRTQLASAVVYILVGPGLILGLLFVMAIRY